MCRRFSAALLSLFVFVSIGSKRQYHATVPQYFQIEKARSQIQKSAIDILRNLLYLKNLMIFQPVPYKIFSQCVNTWRKDFVRNWPKSANLANEWGYARCLIPFIIDNVHFDAVLNAEII